MPDRRNSNLRTGNKNREWGAKAERIAADWLLTHGYTIREQNFRIGNRIEIDIIAEINGTIVFVEVKARSGKMEDPADAVDKAKMRKMIQGAGIYLKNMDHIMPFRLDVITLTGNETDYRIEHFPDAFLPPLNMKF